MRSKKLTNQSSHQASGVQQLNGRPRRKPQSLAVGRAALGQCVRSALQECRWRNFRKESSFSEEVTSVEMKVTSVEHWDAEAPIWERPAWGDENALSSRPEQESGSRSTQRKEINRARSAESLGWRAGWWTLSGEQSGQQHAGSRQMRKVLVRPFDAAIRKIRNAKRRLLARQFELSAAS